MKMSTCFLCFYLVFWCHEIHIWHWNNSINLQDRRRQKRASRTWNKTANIFDGISRVMLHQQPWASALLKFYNSWTHFFQFQSDGQFPNWNMYPHKNKLNWLPRCQPNCFFCLLFSVFFRSVELYDRHFM